MWLAHWDGAADDDFIVESGKALHGEQSDAGRGPPFVASALGGKMTARAPSVPPRVSP